MNKLAITWDQLPSIDIKLGNTPVNNFLLAAFKHLRHVHLDWQLGDNPFDPSIRDSCLIKDRLLSAANELGIDIDPDQEFTQAYTNQLHVEYEKNYDGNPVWLVYHEALHFLEKSVEDCFTHPNRISQRSIQIQYREKEAPFVKKFDRELVPYLTSKRTRGDVYLHWHELGKTPYRYWTDQELPEIGRMCELAKPWLHLTPALYIATTDIDFADEISYTDFNKWFNPFREQWTQHWELNNWSPKEMHQSLVVGHVDDIDTLINRFKQNNLPNKVTPK